MAYLSSQRQKEIDALVESIKLNTGLTYPENSLLDFTKALGLEIYESSLTDFPEVNGIIQYRDLEEGVNGKITLNKNFAPVRKTFTLAHEIGHYFLHKNQLKYRVDKFDYENGEGNMEETEANYFAASFLVPKDKFIQLLKVSNFEGINEIADYFGVSRAVIENRWQWMKKN